MSIATFGELKTAVANWLERSNLTARIPEFIAMGEANIHYGVRSPTGWISEPLRVRAMETATDITIDAQTEALPTGFLAARRLYLDGSPKVNLELLSPVDFWGQDSTATGKPAYFTAEADNLVFSPSPDGTYTGKLLYWKAFTSLSADADTNWLLTNHPAVYLEAALYQAHAFSRNDEQSERHLQKLAVSVNALNLANASDRFGGAPLKIRLGNFVV